ncbi:hypothetical protein, conserved [Eimeria necatrix]|uniref:Uncharacterized protein n=1 Tax=Eimeria necatrix TaxID=51315 RepID=U6MWH9_9EIME|nr:hypothetical protein, conserved [Eimeria necatrix]CDJ67373.1 hypothetical protein, conserved [Eimeria necatrix]
MPEVLVFALLHSFGSAWQMAEEAKEAEGCVTDFSCVSKAHASHLEFVSESFNSVLNFFKGPLARVLGCRDLTGKHPASTATRPRYCETSKSFEFYPESAHSGPARAMRSTLAPRALATTPGLAPRALDCGQTGRLARLVRSEGPSFSLRKTQQMAAAALGNYSGICPLVANFSGFSEAAKRSWSYFTKDMKRSFEHSCQAHFPCENTCEKEYADPCPKGKHAESGF